LSQNPRLPTITIGVARKPQMVFTNLIITTHVNNITDQPSMNLVVIGGHKNTNVANPRGGYREPFVITTQIPNHKDTHFVRPNNLALKYHDSKKMLI